MTAAGHPERIPDLAWVDRDPPYLVPVPGREAQPLRDKRLIWHEPGLPAWRYDLVAVHEANHLNHVGVVDEFDYHRAYRDDVDVALSWVSIDRLWYEEVFWAWDDIPPDLIPPRVTVPDGQPRLPEDTWAVHTMRPPIRRMRVRGAITPGARAALRQPADDGSLHQGLRVISHPHLHDDLTPNLSGGLDALDSPVLHQSLTVCDEADYFAWVAAGTPPPSARVYPTWAILLE